MRRFAIAALLLLLPNSMVIAVYLQYLPAIPVQHTSKLTFEVQESLPILNLTSKGHQLLKFDLILKDDGKNKPLVKLPFALTLKLKDLFVYLNINGIELTIDPRGEKVSVPFVQLAQLLDKPMQFIIDPHGFLVADGDTFKTIFKQQPALKGLSLELLLNEMFFHLFSLCGEELTLGKKLKKATLPDPYHSLPPEITYTITEINDEEIQASMEGSITPKTIAFETSLNADAEKNQKVEMKLSGETKGTISWKRSNALLYTLNNQYHYQAEVTFGDQHWTMQMMISNASSSSPL
jgi:hypothetical protein